MTWPGHARAIDLAARGLRLELAALIRERGAGTFCRLPDGKRTRRLDYALDAWFASARGEPLPEKPHAGAPRRRLQTVQVSVMLDAATHRLWQRHEGDRSAWIRRLMLASNASRTDNPVDRSCQRVPQGHATARRHQDR